MTEQPKPVAESKKVVRYDGKIDLSLGAALATSANTAQTVRNVTETQRNEIVNEDYLLQLWIRFPALIKQKSSLHYLFRTPPVWDSTEQKVKVETSGKIAAQEMTDILPKLTKYLQDNLKNDFIKIEITVDESKAVNMDLSPAGKAKAMAQKNEKLRDLCRKLNLDFA